MILGVVSRGLVLHIGSGVSLEPTAFICMVEIYLKTAVAVSSETLVSTIHMWSHTRTLQCEYFRQNLQPRKSTAVYLNKYQIESA